MKQLFYIIFSVFIITSCKEKKKEDPIPAPSAIVFDIKYNHLAAKGGGNSSFSNFLKIDGKYFSEVYDDNNDVVLFYRKYYTVIEVMGQPSILKTQYKPLPNTIDSVFFTYEVEKLDSYTSFMIYALKPGLNDSKTAANYGFSKDTILEYRGVIIKGKSASTGRKENINDTEYETIAKQYGLKN